MDELFAWMTRDGVQRDELLADAALLQRAVHEAMRLHPASPEAVRRAAQPCTVAGCRLAAGQRVAVDLQAANRDPLVFGGNADQFDPARKVKAGTWPFGLTFGYGSHACLGRALDGGVVPKAGAKPNEIQLGIVALLVKTLLAHGAEVVPDNPPQPDPNTIRNHFATYPIRFPRGAGQ